MSLLYIEAGLDISPLSLYNTNQYIYTSSKNMFDDFTKIMKKEGYKIVISCIYYNKPFMVEYHNKNKRLIYYFNIEFPKDYYTIIKEDVNIILSNIDYIKFIADYFPNIKSICISP